MALRPCGKMVAGLMSIRFLIRGHRPRQLGQILSVVAARGHLQGKFTRRLPLRGPPNDTVLPAAGGFQVPSRHADDSKRSTLERNGSASSSKFMRRLVSRRIACSRHSRLGNLRISNDCFATNPIQVIPIVRLVQQAVRGNDRRRLNHPVQAQGWRAHRRAACSG
jgi:hypothetical protein